MNNKIRLIVISTHQDFVKASKNGLQNKPNIEMLIFVTSIFEAENKLNRDGYRDLFGQVAKNEQNIEALWKRTDELRKAIDLLAAAGRG